MNNRFDAIGSEMPRTEIAPDYSVSRVIKGEWQLSQGHLLGESVDRDAAIEDTITFTQRGITTLDFGDIYLGVEQLVGDCLKRLKERYGSRARQMMQLHTKYVPDADKLPTHSFADVKKITDRSRERLGVETLDLVQFHWWNYNVQGYVDAMLDLQRLQSAGNIRLIGVTNFDVPRLQEFVEAGVTPSTIQLQYSALDHRPSNGMTDFCADHNISMLCYGTVAGGFLSDKYLGMSEPCPPFKNRSLAKYKLIIDEFGGWDLFQELLRALKRVSLRHNVSLATIASAYVLHRPQVAGVIVGAHDKSHLDDNVKIGNVRLSPEDIGIIESVIDRSAGPSGEVYGLERNDPKHAGIMHTSNNKVESSK
jgi:aryl-alcohol dehydrogenase-like predicted oxidoreductase